MTPKDPAVNEVCLNCTLYECPGICDRLRDAMGKASGEIATSITLNGVTRSVRQWSEILGLTRQTIYNRMKKGLPPEEVLSSDAGTRNEKYPQEFVEEVYMRLSRMHLDYKLFWDNPRIVDDSAGMVTNYNKIMSSPTNRISSVVETRAMPELALSDYAIERREWIGVVLFLIDDLRMRDYGRTSKWMTLSLVLEWRAIDGMTVRKIVDKLQELHANYGKPITIHYVRECISEIVDEIIPIAQKRGLLIDPKNKKRQED